MIARTATVRAEQARALLARHLAWDNHACLPLRPGDMTFLPQIERARAAGWHAVTVNIGFGDQGPESHLAMLAHFRAWFGARSDYLLATTADDLDRARAAGRLAVLFDIEGACAVGGRLDLVERYRDGGVRWMLIAYNRENAAGYGCMDAEDAGLKPFGRALVAALDRAGITVCCSHTGHRTACDVLARAIRPVIFSHSNCATLYGHPRNISDDLIRACATTGGVVGICGIGDFLAPKGADRVDAMLNHIDHVAQLVGPEAVGLSLDYVYDRQELLDHLAAHPDQFPPGFDAEAPMLEPEHLTPIVAGLFARGYAEPDIAAIVGGNWLRVARANWSR